jgi:hypothetical protein
LHFSHNLSAGNELSGQGGATGVTSGCKVTLRGSSRICNEEWVLNAADTVVFFGCAKTKFLVDI